MQSRQSQDISMRCSYLSLSLNTESFFTLGLLRTYNSLTAHCLFKFAEKKS